jgi:hypothetical protein
MNVNWQDSNDFLKLTTIELKNIVSKGFSQSGNIFIDKTLYKNNGFRQIWELLGNIQAIWHAVIQGPPGIGKSHAAWALSCAYAAKGNLVVHAFMEGTSFATIAVLQSNVILRMTKEACSAAEGLKIMQGIYPGSLHVIDGVSQNTRDLFLTLRGPWILVTSTGLRFTDHQVEILDKPTIINVESWKLEEYKKALLMGCSSQTIGPVTINDDVLKCDAEELSLDPMPAINDGILEGDADEVTLDLTSHEFLERWLEEKYFFCGGSVRYMFVFTLQIAKNTIRNAFQHQNNLSDLFGNEDSMANTAISSLRQCIDGKYIVLSQYVVRLLSAREDVTEQLISLAKSYAEKAKNNAFKGWLHEWQMLSYLKQCIQGSPTTKSFKLRLIGQSGTREEVLIKFPQTDSFFKCSDIAQTLESDQVLLMPEKFNQGCYDAAVVLLKRDQPEKDVLLLLQATVAKEHSFKPKFVIELILQLAANTETQRNQLSVTNIDDEPEFSEPSAKKLRQGPATTGKQQAGIKTQSPTLVPSGTLCLWHCFIFETQEQLERFKLPELKSVGIRSLRQPGWKIDSVFWKALLEKPK